MNGIRLNNLRFADDIVLIGDGWEEIRETMREFITTGGEAGLEMNVYKTKYMSNRSTENLKVDNVEIDRVAEYTYLGRIYHGVAIKYINGIAIKCINGIAIKYVVIRSYQN